MKKHYPVSRFENLTEAHLPQVLEWRNLPHIRDNMHQATEISWTQHKAWFDSVCNDPNRQVMLFLQDKRPIGILNFSRVNSVSVEWGCYIGETNTWPGSGLILEIAALDFFSMHMDADVLVAEVLSFNRSVLNMHRMFGYEAKSVVEKAGRRHDENYDVHVFNYTKADWDLHRSSVLEKLPKQIAEAAKLIEFEK